MFSRPPWERREAGASPCGFRENRVVTSTKARGTRGRPSPGLQGRDPDEAGGRPRGRSKCSPEARGWMGGYVTLIHSLKNETACRP